MKKNGWRTLVFILLFGAVTLFSGCGFGVPRESAKQYDTALQKTQPLAPIHLDPKEHSNLYYGRRTLSGAEVEAYDRISQALREHSTTVATRGVAYDRLFEICTCVTQDHPEYFWYSGTVQAEYPENDPEMNVTLTFTYSMDAAQADATMQKIETRMTPFFNSLMGRSDYEKVKKVYEYVIEHTAYEEGCEDQSMCSVLLEGRGVCAGYTKAMQYLLQQLDVETLYASGTAGGESHSWNLVRIDGAYYVVDATWGDPVLDGGEQVLLYDYLCVTTQEISRTHKSDTPLPMCTRTDYDYYKRSGCLFSDCRDERLYDQLKAALDQGKPLGMKFTDEAAFLEAKRKLLDNSEVQLLLSRYTQESGRTLGGYTWSVNDNLYTIHLEAQEASVE